MIYENITEKIIEAIFNVYNFLGYGFLEKVYEKSMLVELRSLGINAKSQREIAVKYKGIIVGYYLADLVVENKIILELKAAEKIIPIHKIQLLNYLKASDKVLGLVLNFGEKPQIKRIINSKNSNLRKSDSSVQSVFPTQKKNGEINE